MDGLLWLSRISCNALVWSWDMISDPYEQNGKVQVINLAWDAEGFDPFVPRGWISHLIVAGTLAILAGLFKNTVAYSMVVLKHQCMSLF
jgi:hypothetical protein